MFIGTEIIVSLKSSLSFDSTPQTSDISGGSPQSFGLTCCYQILVSVLTEAAAYLFKYQLLKAVFRDLDHPKHRRLVTNTDEFVLRLRKQNEKNCFCQLFLVVSHCWSDL